MGDGIVPVNEEYGHAQVDQQQDGRDTGKKSKHQEERGEHFCRNAQEQAPAVTDMKRVEEAMLQLPEVGDLGNAVIETHQGAESNPG